MKHKTVDLAVLKLVLVILAITAVGTTSFTSRVVGATPAVSSPLQNPDDPRIAAGLALSPVPLNLMGKDRRLVGLGSYAVNAIGGCWECHTSPPYLMGSDPYVGQMERVNATAYLAGGVKFGPFTSRNLTPDSKSGKPADMDFDQFLRTIRTGVDEKQLHPQMGPLLQVMPWPVFRKMTDSDLRAVYEFLTAIPHADTPK